jgi:hypothetical protein
MRRVKLGLILLLVSFLGQATCAGFEAAAAQTLAQAAPASSASPEAARKKTDVSPSKKKKFRSVKNGSSRGNCSHMGHLGGCETYVPKKGEIM